MTPCPAPTPGGSLRRPRYPGRERRSLTATQSSLPTRIQRDTNGHAPTGVVAGFAPGQAGAAPVRTRAVSRRFIPLQRRSPDEAK